jgi:hypothetical protein
MMLCVHECGKNKNDRENSSRVFHWEYFVHKHANNIVCIIVKERNRGLSHQCGYFAEILCFCLDFFAALMHIHTHPHKSHRKIIIIIRLAHPISQFSAYHRTQLLEDLSKKHSTVYHDIKINVNTTQFYSHIPHAICNVPLLVPTCMREGSFLRGW